MHTGDHDHVWGGFAAQDFSQHSESTLVGQAQIEEHHVEGLLVDLKQALSAACARGDLVPVLLQLDLQRATNGDVVVDNQDSNHGLTGCDS